jgi:hypothetical protein
MTRFLKSRELCPIHHSYFCVPCHKPQKKFPASTWGKRGELRTTPLARSPRRFQPAVEVVIDPHHSRGFREIVNDREKKRRLAQHIHQQEGKCYLCGVKFNDMRYVEFCHKRSRGMNGSWRDDSMENTFAGHKWCNNEQGSREVA